MLAARTRLNTMDGRTASTCGSFKLLG